MARACCQVAGLPAASTTESGPRLSSVKAFTAATTSGVSVTLMVAIAPSLRATSRGAERRANAITRTPRRESMRTNVRPMGPQPTTAAVSPARTSISWMPRSTQASGTAVVDGVRHLEHILRRDPAGNAHVLGVRAIVEEQILAKIFLAAAAVI